MSADTPTPKAAPVALSPELVGSIIHAAPTAEAAAEAVALICPTAKAPAPAADTSEQTHGAEAPTNTVLDAILARENEKKEAAKAAAATKKAIAKAAAQATAPAKTHGVQLPLKPPSAAPSKASDAKPALPSGKQVKPS